MSAIVTINGVQISDPAIAAAVESLTAERDRLKQAVISGFYEDEVPMFRNGTPTHELEEIVTAEEVTGYVRAIENRKNENKELIQKLAALQARVAELERAAAQQR